MRSLSTRVPIIGSKQPLQNKKTTPCLQQCTHNAQTTNFHSFLHDQQVRVDPITHQINTITPNPTCHHNTLSTNITTHKTEHNQFEFAHLNHKAMSNRTSVVPGGVAVDGVSIETKYTAADSGVPPVRMLPGTGGSKAAKVVGKCSTAGENLRRQVDESVRRTLWMNCWGSS